MQAAPEYDDVVGEVHRFLAERMFAAEMAGIAKKNIVVDPGFGFGKNRDHNLALLAQLRALRRTRRAGAGRAVAQEDHRRPDRPRRSARARPRLGAAALIAAQRGAQMVRVHDVAATVDALKVWHAVAQSSCRAEKPRRRSMPMGRRRDDRGPSEPSVAPRHRPDGARPPRARPRSRWNGRSGSAARSSASIRRWSIAAWTSARPSRRRGARARAAPPDRHARSVAALLGGRVRRRCARRDRRDRSRAAAADPGRRHRAVFPGAVRRPGADARSRSGDARRDRRTKRRRGLAGAARRTGRGRSATPRAHPRHRSATHPARAGGVPLSGGPISAWQAHAGARRLPLRVLKLVLVAARPRACCTRASSSASTRCSRPASSTKCGACAHLPQLQAHPRRWTCPRCARSATGRPGSTWTAPTAAPNSATAPSPPRASSPSAS